MQLLDTLEKIQSNDFVVEVFGIGYVGFPLLTRLADSGIKVIGIDTDEKRINRLEENLLEDSELHIKPIFLEARKNKLLSFSKVPSKSDKPKIGIICVPTPNKNQNSNVYVFSAVENFLKSSKSGDLLILESSVMNGTTETVKKMIEENGFQVGSDYGLCFCPERIDPLNKKWNLENIPRIIYASDDTTFTIAQKIYHHVNKSHLTRVSSAKTAEIVKSYENAFRLVNISLVNELAILCDNLNVNVKEVIEAAATKPFGFMPFYPGAGAGGHCIPKDPIFLLESARENNLQFSSIKEALRTNLFVPKYIVGSIEEILDNLKLEKSVVVCGLAYKPDIEDMRDSPGFKILNEFNNRNFKISAYDPYFKKELKAKYLVENYLESLEFFVLNDLEKQLKEYNCICIVQHHTKTKFLLNRIYKNSEIPVIFDCQNQLKTNSGSKSVLMRFGNR